VGHRIAELNDAALALRVQASGDRAAFGELVRRHQGALRAFLWRLAGGAAAADDLAQDTLIRAYERIGGFRGNAAFRTWLFAIAWREFLGSRRKADAYARMLATGAESAKRDEAIAGGDPDAALDLQRGLALLSVEERAALLLCDACGMSHGEASAALGLPLGSVKTYVARARARMRAMLDVAPEAAPVPEEAVPCRIAR
jgi:RNA polymerase sigma-70 factor (ECF subfamily)